MRAVVASGQVKVELNRKTVQHQEGGLVREIRVREAETAEPRARFVCDVVHRGFRREFLGYNRARSAVLEATILATRTRFLPIGEILAEFRRLQVIVDKTAGPPEREAMAMLTDFVRSEAAALGGGGA